MRVRAAFLNATLVAGVFSVACGCTRKPALDEWTEEYRRAGDDLSKPRIIFFAFGFPAESAAEQAAQRARAAGFSVRVFQDTEGAEWVCNATTNMIPESAAIQRTQAQLAEIAATAGGHFAGSGIPVASQSGGAHAH